MLRRLAVCLTILYFFTLAGCSRNCSGIDHDSSVYWLPEESGFVDYEIDGDCVRFRYRICFVNETEQDVSIKVSAAFSPKELAGWVESKDYFDGFNNRGDWTYQTVGSFCKNQLIYTFEGKYLGGEVNTNLSFPEDLMVVLAENESQNRSDTEQNTTVQLNNGKIFTYFQHESPSNWQLKDIKAETATLDQIMFRLEPYEASDTTDREIRTAKEAAYYGATALNRHFSHWTEVDMVGVLYNPLADLWFVHGMLKDRNDPGEARLVVLDAATGKVLGFTELIPSAD